MKTYLLNRKMTAIVAIFAAFLCLTATAPVQADEPESFISLVNTSINVQSNRIELSDSQIKGYAISHRVTLASEYPAYAGQIDKFVTDMETLITDANAKLSSGEFTIRDDGQMIPKRTTRAAYNFKLEWYWWGTRRIFYTDKDAREFAAEMDEAEKISDLAAISSIVFPGMGVIGGISALYARSVASSVRWAADQPGNGVILDTHYVLTYKAIPR